MRETGGQRMYTNILCKKERGQELELLGFFFKDGISKINIKYFINEVIYVFTCRSLKVYFGNKQFSVLSQELPFARTKCGKT